MKLLFPTDKSGAVGDIVYTRNRQGVAVRARVQPLNPQTVAQQAQRSILAGVSGSWRGLTQTQRNEWSAQAVNYPGNLSGFNLFVGVNALLITLGLPVIEDAFAPPAQGVFTTSGLTVTAVPAMSIGAVNNTVAPDKYIIEGTPGMSQGKSNLNSGFRMLGAMDPPLAAQPLNILALYQAKFGNPVVGDKIAIRVTGCYNGVKGVPYILQAIVAAGA